MSYGKKKKIKERCIIYDRNNRSCSVECRKCSKRSCWSYDDFPNKSCPMAEKIKERYIIYDGNLVVSHTVAN